MPDPFRSQLREKCYIEKFGGHGTCQSSYFRELVVKVCEARVQQRIALLLAVARFVLPLSDRTELARTPGTKRLSSYSAKVL